MLILEYKKYTVRHVRYFFSGAQRGATVSIYQTRIEGQKTKYFIRKIPPLGIVRVAGVRPPYREYKNVTC